MLPEAEGDVFEGVVVVAPIHALIGGGLVEGTQVADERPNLDVVEVCLVDSGGDAYAPAVPGNLELGMRLVNILCEHVYAYGVAVASHEGKAGDISTIL